MQELVWRRRCGGSPPSCTRACRAQGTIDEACVAFLGIPGHLYELIEAWNALHVADHAGAHLAVGQWTAKRADILGDGIRVGRGLQRTSYRRRGNHPFTQ